MRNTIIIKLSILLLSLIPSFLSAQTEMRQTKITIGPNYKVESITTASSEENLTNLDIYIKIAYDELQFIKFNELYRATYELSIIIYDESGDRRMGRVILDTITVGDFLLTNSREEFSIKKTNFLIINDTYRIDIGVMDLDTRKTGFRQMTISVPNYDKRLAVSDIILLDYLMILRSGEVKLTPSISNSFISESSDFQVYYEIYGVNKSISVRNIVTDIEGNEIYSEIFDAEPLDGVIKIYDSIKQEELKFNKYIFIVEVGKGTRMVRKSKTFRVRWFGMSETITDLDKAVEYLRYIANETELEKMLASDTEIKRKLFIQYWKNRDPTPESEGNELMVEYYKRVQFSNENFATFTDGWKSDMGMVYILFGNPNDIERHPFDMGQKPYEVWFYHKLNKQFVFTDNFGFGEYKLVTPLFDTSRSDF